MSATGLEVLDHTVQLTHEYVVRHALPFDIRTIWPEAYAEPGAIRR